MNRSKNESKVVELFHWIDQVTLVLMEHKNEPYLDSLAIALEVLFYDEIDIENNVTLKREVQKHLSNINVNDYDIENIRKAIQLAVLKGMKKTTQHQHVMTPETVSLFIGYLANKLTSGLEEIRLFDPASGTANLLLIVMSQFTKPVRAYGSEIDPTLLKLSLLNANLQKKEVEFFHQDSLRPLLLDPVDLVVADLPVGYYPDDVLASNFELKSKEGHSYSHHLFIEQSLTYTKDGGFLLFIIPESLFESDQSRHLHRFIQKNAHIVGVIQLAESTFASKEHKKSIFIIRKKGKQTKDIKQPLLAILPSFNNSNEMENILVKINEWFDHTASYLK